MSTAALSLLGTVTALVAGVWAGLLVMVQERPGASAALRTRTSLAGELTLLGRVTRIGRIALLFVAGVAASEAVGWWYQPLGVGLGRAGLALALLYLIAEGLPRSAAVLVPKFAAALDPVARLTLSPFTPLVGVATTIEAWIESILPVPVRSADRFGKAHRDMLHGVFTLGETTVAEIMTPRLDIMAVESSADWKAVVEFLGRSDHARILVYSDDLDDVQGVLYAKDLTPAVAGVSDAPADWREFVRPAQFVPESKVLTAQLRDFQRGRSGLAVVVDEFGGTSGLVTLEDVLEEVVGEIHGEYDVDDPTAVEKEGDDRFWVDGRFPLDDLSELLGEAVEREDVTTVGGLVYSELGRVPTPGEELRIEGFRVVVEQIVRRRIRRVYFERTPPTSFAEAVQELNE
ncbi:hemolysin family protein [Gemmatimonadota bacterium]